MLARDVVEGRGRDVVGLTLADEAVVLEEVLLLRVVRVGLRSKDALGLTPSYELALAAVE